MIKSAIDLRAPRLRPAVGGFARDEVQAFLAAAADDYEAAITALEQLRAEHAQVTASLLEARNHEREVARVLSAAERSAQEVLGRAHQAADERIRAAERRIADLLGSADAERERILIEIASLRDRRSRIVSVLETEIVALREPVPVDAPAAELAATAAPDSDGATPVQGVEAEETREPRPADVAHSSDGPQTAAARRDSLDALVAREATVLDRTASEAAAEAECLPALVNDDGKTSGAGSDETVEGPAPAEPCADALHAPEPRPEAASPVAAAVSEPNEEPAPNRDGLGESIPAAGDGTSDEGHTRTPRRRVLLAAGVAAVAIMSVAAIPWLRTSSADAADRTDATSPRPQAGVERILKQPAAAAGEREPAREQTDRADNSARSAQNAATSAPSPGAIAVRLEATSTCWLRFTTGDQSEEFLLEPGDVVERTATADVVLRTGNAGALLVSVNGRVIPPLGREGEVVTRRITRPISLIH